MKVKISISEILVILAANLLYAAGVVFFIIPAELITGGTTGLALAINHYSGFSVASSVFIFNALMFVAGFLVLGKKFAFTTLISSIFFPIALGLLQTTFGHLVLTTDLLLCTVFASLAIGISIAMVIRVGASTGGLSIPPLIFHKYWRIPVSLTLYVIDCLVLGAQIFFSPTDKILYGIILVILYSLILDKLLMFGTGKIQLEVISKQTNEIKEMIIEKFDRGVTLLHGQTGYANAKTDLLLSVISQHELVKMEKLIRQIDPEAFVIISHVTEVQGRGFSLSKKYIKNK
ncbi:MAG TPA: YitT family protein [Candidatus Avacidaminococcus intestinavium]|uniref:YitT family protein n=1 Tax=Candidatus Avacidaminococcus intestinavium TaxID=2840684 RepID=A0A9D1MNT6_9FIRM|nr:YitT family protein [Candidatus Avacidaminococcus intestinavium]